MSTSTLDRPTTTTRRRSNIHKRMGSQQVVSVRGRRVTSEQGKVKKSTIRFLAVVLMIAGLGVGFTMYFSGVTTEQSFAISKAKEQKQQLSNEIETLQRDLTRESSDASVAQKAAKLGMVVPDQPGILRGDGAGNATELLPADPSKTHEVKDFGIATGAATPAKETSTGTTNTDTHDAATTQNTVTTSHVENSNGNQPR